MEMEIRAKTLQDEADKILDYLTDLEERGNLSSNKSARTLYNKNKKKLEAVIDELASIQQNKEERGEQDMIKMNNEKEERGMTEFAQILRNEGESRALTTTTSGSTLIPTDVSQQVILKMVEISPVFAQARKLTPINGSIKVNRENDTIVSGFVGEGTDVLEQVINFLSVELQQKRVGAAISLTNQLINDSGIDIAAYVKDLLARRTIKAIEKSMLVGVGGTEFSGVVNDADIKHVDVANLAGVSIDTMFDLYNSINPDFLDGASYIMQRNFFNVVSKFKDQMGHFYMQNGVVNGKLTYTLFGVPVYVTDVLADLTPALFMNTEEAVSMLIKKDMGILEVVDTQNALRGARTYVFDMYADSSVVNPQAVSKLVLNA